MSIIRNTASGLMKGRVGNTTFYVMNGQQVARQARNNSNYGEGAMRSYAQQARRVKWSNLVNFYKACKDWMPKAFENKKRSQSDYNKFMSVNINSSRVSLTKDQALNGSAVVESIIVSQGSITPIAQEYILARNVMTSDIKLTVTNLGMTPIAQLTQDIITQNPMWSAGDNLALVLFSNGTDERGYPYVQTTYHEFTLDSTSAQPFSSLPIAQYLVKDTTSSALSLSTSGIPQFMGAVFIHTRKAQSILMTSTQRPVLFNTVILDHFITQEQLDLAIASYGISDDVPLDPSFMKGSIVNVKLDDVVNPNIPGSIIQHSGAVVLSITGHNVSRKNLWIDHDGVRYTPLNVDGNTWTYILDSNGANRIMLNDMLYGGVEIVNAQQPSELEKSKRIFLFPSDTWQWGSEIDKLFVSSNCINYPRMATSSANHYIIELVTSSALSEDDIDIVNGTINEVRNNAEGTVCTIYVIADVGSNPTYFSYKGSLVAVFNYEQ